MDNNISFSKIVATPTLNSWSQAYNAGKLFAVISLEKTKAATNIESLNMLGKDMLERLEQEFFVIEDKNLETIKKAVSTTFEKQTEGVNLSFAAGVFISNVLYLFALGKGKAFVKRDNNLGLVLDSSSNSKDIVSSSGFLKENDLIVLATNAFSETITQEDINSGLTNDLPADIAESLAPKIHKASDGRISAIVIKYGNPQEIQKEELSGSENISDSVIAREAIDEKPVSSFNKYLSLLKSKFKRPNIRFDPAKKLFLVVAIIIVGILISSIFFAIQKQNNAKIQALFSEIYPAASKKYEEGQGLLDLNRNLARDSFVSAQKILTENKDKFPAKSKEANQIQELLKKVDNGLAEASGIDKSGLNRSTLSITVQNGSGTEGVAGKAADVLKELGYNVASTGNADNYNYNGVTIKVKKEKSNFLDLLKKDLSKDYTISSSTSDLPSSSPTDCLIIIGK